MTISNNGYLAVPVTGPEDIQDNYVREKVEALVLVKGTKPVLYEVSPYVPSSEPEEVDPRGFWRCLWDGLTIRFLPKSERAQITTRIAQERDIATVQNMYDWALQNKDGVVGSLQRLRQAYEGICKYIDDTERGIETLQDGLTTVESRKEEVAENLSKLNDSINSDEFYSSLESRMDKTGADSTITRLTEDRDLAQQELIRYEAEIEPQLDLVRTYVDTLVTEFSGDVVASKQSLGTIEQTIKETLPIRLRLEITLRRYEGLTRNEIDAMQATQFLEDMRSVMGGLNEQARRVHSAWLAQAEAFEMTSDQPYAPALPETNLLIAPEEEFE